MDISSSFNDIQLLNIFDISKTFWVLKLLIFTNSNDLHSSNKCDIFSTFAVLIFSNLIEVKDKHPLNIEDISLLLFILKLDKSIVDIFSHPENNPLVVSTLLKSLISTEIKFVHD